MLACPPRCLRAPLPGAGRRVIFCGPPALATCANAKREGVTITYLHCPHCGLTITPKADWLRLEHCPRCIARRGALVTLFSSSLPVEALYHEDARPEHRRRRPADQEPAPTT